MDKNYLYGPIKDKVLCCMFVLDGISVLAGLILAIYLGVVK
jgi:hypothetical protein